MAIANLRVNSGNFVNRPYGVSGRTTSEVKANAIEAAANSYKSPEYPKVYAISYKRRFKY